MLPPPINVNFLKRILIADDDVVLRATLASMLGAEGYDVTQAGDSEQTIALHRRRPFDLVIAVLNREGKDSFEMIAELLRGPHRTRLIALVGKGWPSADFCLRQAEELGARAVLLKPFPPEQLLSAVRTALA
jgi:DNA-binding response OmpR family regulator